MKTLSLTAKKKLRNKYVNYDWIPKHEMHAPVSMIVWIHFKYLTTLQHLQQ